MKRMTQIKFYSLIWFIMVSFEASGTLPVFHVDAKDKTGVGIGKTLGKAFKKQFPEIEKIYDTYLGSFVVQEQFGGEIKHSSKNVGMREGKQIYRMTYLLRLPAFKKGDFILASAEFRRAIAIDSTQAVYYFNYGLSLGKAGYYKEAAAMMKKTLSLDPDFTPAGKVLKALETNNR